MNDYIVIPCQLIRDNSLTNTELFLLMEINQLSMLQYGCIANNEHFATKFNLKKESVSRSLNELQRKGFVSIEIKKGSRNFNRTITINKMLFDYKQNVTTPLTKCEESKEKVTIKKTINTFTPPSLEEIKQYTTEKNLNIDANKFYDYFEVSDWKDSKGNKVKNWKQKILTWANYNKNNKSFENNKTNSGNDGAYLGWH